MQPVLRQLPWGLWKRLGETPSCAAAPTAGGRHSSETIPGSALGFPLSTAAPWDFAWSSEWVCVLLG